MLIKLLEEVVESDNVFFNLSTLLFKFLDMSKGSFGAMHFSEGCPEGMHKVMPQGFIIIQVGQRVDSISVYFDNPFLRLLGHPVVDSRPIE